MDKVDREILLFIQGDLPLVSKPYAEFAKGLGIDEIEVCDRIAGYVESGLIRRFGAVLRHGKAGYSANALVVWEVDDAKRDEAASVLAESDAVSHLYARPAFKEWPYNLYSMVHARSEDELKRLTGSFVEKLAGLVKSHRVLRSVREFKKTSMKYFTGDE